MEPVAPTTDISVTVQTPSASGGAALDLPTSDLTLYADPPSVGGGRAVYPPSSDPILVEAAIPQLWAGPLIIAPPAAAVRPAAPAPSLGGGAAIATATLTVSVQPARPYCWAEGTPPDRPDHPRLRAVTPRRRLLRPTYQRAA